MLTAAVTGYYKYGDRGDQFEKSLKGLTDTLGALKRQVAVGLGDRLKPVFENAGSVTSVILDTSGKQFQENYVNPIGSESYREAILGFAQSDAAAMVDLRNLLHVRDRWLRWARVLSWTCLIALIIESLLTGSLFIASKVMGVSVDQRLGLSSAIPAIIAFITFVVSAVRMNVLHDRFVELRKQYASP